MSDIGAWKEVSMGLERIKQALHREAALNPNIVGPNEMSDYKPMMIALEKIKKGK